MTVAHAAAQSGNAKENVLFSFQASGNLGNTPNGVLISDGAGNFYGSNTYGADGNGSVFEISPTAEGGWTAKSIYPFPKNSGSPAGLAMDSSGNLYVVAYGALPNLCSDGFSDYGCGAVYELSPNGSGGWSRKTLWNASQSEGWQLWSLVIDASGNLYGTSACIYGSCGGTVYELKRTGENWTHVILHTFSQPGSDDGAEPVGPLVFDKAGNIYGATYLGSAGCGSVFELEKTKNSYREITLSDLTCEGSDSGANNVIFDNAGNLYGTTLSFGTDPVIAFELTPTSSGAWQETELESFAYGGQAGYGLVSLIFNSVGSLFGTASFGGSEGYGTAFQMKQSTNGTWSAVVLHSFPSDSTDGEYPQGLLPDSKGNLFGVTSGGGTAGVGTVFEIKP